MKSKVTQLRIKCAKKLSGLILDLGAGEGDYTQFLNGDIVSLDVDFENLRNINGKKVCAKANRLPFSNQVFDGVWACAVLEHSRENFIPELIRVTKPKGRIFILTPNRQSLYDPIKRLFGLKDWTQNKGHVRLYSHDELKEFGKIYGEVWWLPGLDQIARICPALGHTLMLEINV